MHFLRDNPNVPSDLEQMPNLLNFIRGNGTMMTNDHTVLISHTANGILTSLTGVYRTGMGRPCSTSFRYFKVGRHRRLRRPRSSTGPTWSTTSARRPTDPTPDMVNGDSGRQDHTGAMGAIHARRL